MRSISSPRKPKVRSQAAEFTSTRFESRDIECLFAPSVTRNYACAAASNDSPSSRPSVVSSEWRIARRFGCHPFGRRDTNLSRPESTWLPLRAARCSARRLGLSHPVAQLSCRRRCAISTASILWVVPTVARVHCRSYRNAGARIHDDRCRIRNFTVIHLWYSVGRFATPRERGTIGCTRWGSGMRI